MASLTIPLRFPERTRVFRSCVNAAEKVTVPSATRPTSVGPTCAASVLPGAPALVFIAMQSSYSLVGDRERYDHDVYQDPQP